MTILHRFHVVYSIATRQPHLALEVTYRGCTRDEALDAHDFILYMGRVSK